MPGCGLTIPPADDGTTQAKRLNLGGRQRTSHWGGGRDESVIEDATWLRLYGTRGINMAELDATIRGLNLCLVLGARNGGTNDGLCHRKAVGFRWYHRQSDTENQGGWRDADTQTDWSDPGLSERTRPAAVGRAGIDFNPFGKRQNILKRVEQLIKRVAKAELKPQQKVELIRHYLIP
ncbi:hypothetical protein D918_07476 [Trichuris suis]|nr:hypothetical protein D918_07476 [Trichuris suis]